MANIRRNLGIPAGVVFQSAATAAPYGYLVCDGSEVLKSDYPELYLAIGDTYGTATGGSLYFCLPDYRGRFLRGFDGTAGNDPDKTTRTAMKAGAATGNSVGSLQDTAAPNITGTFGGARGGIYSGATVSGAITTGTSRSAVESGQSGASNDMVINAALSSSVYQSTTEARPKNVNVNFIIKY